MNDLVIALFYLYVVLLGILDIGAFYFTYRITKVVGAFRGWILMLIFVVVFATEGVVTLGASAALTIVSPSRLDTYLDSPSGSSFLGTGLYNLLLAFLLFGSMYELYRTFKRVSSKSPADTEEKS